MKDLIITVISETVDKVGKFIALIYFFSNFQNPSH